MTHVILFYLKFLLQIVWLIVGLVWGFIMCIVHFHERIENPSFGVWVGRPYAWGALKILGVKLVIKNEHYLKETSPGVVVCNHQSLLDFIFACAIVPKKCVAIGKQSILYVPVFGQFWWLANQILIDRSHRASAIGTLGAAVKRIKQYKHSVWIFPEGTRNEDSEGNGLLPFKKGAFHVAIESGAPIVPVVMAPLSSIADWKTKHIYGGEYHISVLPPIPVTNLTKSDVDTLLEKVRSEMANEMENLKKLSKKQK